MNFFNGDFHYVSSSSYKEDMRYSIVAWIKERLKNAKPLVGFPL